MKTEYITPIKRNRLLNSTIPRHLVVAGLVILGAMAMVFRSNAQSLPCWDNAPDLGQNVPVFSFTDGRGEVPKHSVGSGQYVYFICDNYADTDVYGLQVWRWGAGDGWTLLGTAVNGYFNALAISGTNLYVGGSFEGVCYDSNCDSISATNIAIFNLATGQWSEMKYSEEDRAIGAIVVDHAQNVYVGTETPLSIRGLTSDTPGYGYDPEMLMKWNGSAWAAVGGGLTSYIDTDFMGITAMATDGTNVFVGGRFDMATNISPAQVVYSHGIIKWDGQKWGSMGNTNFWGVFWEWPAANSGGFEDGFTVTAVAVAGTNVFVTGNFYYPYGSLARFSTITGKLLTTDVPVSQIYGFGPVTFSGYGWFSGSAYDLVVHNGVVYLTGGFEAMGTNNNFYPSLVPSTPKSYAMNIACWNSSNSTALGNWRNLGIGTGTRYPEEGFCLAANTNAVFVAGTLYSAGGIPLTNGIARWVTATDIGPCPSAILSGGSYANGTFSCNVTGTAFSTWQICSRSEGVLRSLGTIQLDQNGNGFLSDAGAGYYNNFDSFDGAGNGAYWLSNNVWGTVTRQYGYWQTMVPAGMESYAVVNGSVFYSSDNTLNANLPATAFTYPYNAPQNNNYDCPSMTGDLVPVTDLDDYVDNTCIWIDVSEDNYDHILDSSGTFWYVPDGAVDPSNPAYSGDQISFGPGDVIWLYQDLNNDVVISLFGYWN